MPNEKVNGEMILRHSCRRALPEGLFSSPFQKHPVTFFTCLKDPGQANILQTVQAMQSVENITF
eukprot:scaffold138037_cov22-Prasinocladus_malaysianus.AAC.1